MKLKHWSILLVVIIALGFVYYLSADYFSSLIFAADKKINKYEDCYICQYQNVDECDRINKQSSYDWVKARDCKNVVVNKQFECSWVDGVCKSIWQEKCEKWVADRKGAGVLSVAISINDSLISIIKSNQCVTPHYRYIGHSSEKSCLRAADPVITCLTCGSPQAGGQGFFTNYGCRTFKDWGRVMEAAKLIQTNLRKQFRGKLLLAPTIYWTANQATAGTIGMEVAPRCFSNEMNSLQSIEITVASISVAYDSCSNLGNQCFQPYEKATCSEGTGKSKKNVQKMCCPGGWFSSLSWTDVNLGTGFCSNYEVSSRSVCSGWVYILPENAKNHSYEFDAQEEMEQCLTKTEKWCLGMGGGYLFIDDPTLGKDYKEEEFKDKFGKTVYQITSWWTCYKKK
ncbi:MAG: hypothetical protein ABH822_01605 [Patescibacteria group bacterium]